MTFWTAIVLGGAATYLTRLLPLVVTPSIGAPPALRRYLDALPIAVIAALAGAGIAVPGTAVTHGAEVIAASVVFSLAAWRHNLLVAMVAGVAAVALLRALSL